MQMRRQSAFVRMTPPSASARPSSFRRFFRNIQDSCACSGGAHLPCTHRNTCRRDWRTLISSRIFRSDSWVVIARTVRGSRRAGHEPRYASALERGIVRLAGADADDAVDVGDEDLAVADLAGLRGLEDRFDHLIHEVAAHG